MSGGKRCFKCGETKPLYQFYLHSKMSDGHLNKCKDCTKKDSAQRISVVKRIPEWVAMERERCRLKEKIKRAIFGSRQYPGAQIRWQKKHPEQRKAQQLANNAVRDGKIKRKATCEGCGITGVRLHKHHADYSQPLSVAWLCPSCHGIQHRKPTPQAA